MNLPMLMMGSNGPYVTIVQRALNLGDSVLQPLDDDGIFGMLTRQRVKEFQSQSGLTPDGVAGPLTYQQMSEFIQAVMQLLPPLSGEADARSRIVSATQAALFSMGWADTNPSPPSAATGAIAANLGDASTDDGLGNQSRLGGTSLAVMHQIAGAPGASRCLTIGSTARREYANNREWNGRSVGDIPEWCGIFALYVYRICGLKMPSWPEKPFRTFGGSRPCNPVVSINAIQPGDIGVIDGLRSGGSNHHFIVVQTNRDPNGFVTSVSSIDGNTSTNYQSIQKRTRSFTSFSIDGQGAFQILGGGGSRQVTFASPRWDKVL